MIRSHFEDREPHDVAANQCQVGGAGELILNAVELAEVINPDLTRRTVPQAVSWLRTYGPASRWLWAEPVANESAEDGEVQHPMEAYVR